MTKRGAADHGRPVEQVRMLLVVIPVVGTAAVREGRKLIAFEEMERPVFAVAQPRGGFDDLVHHRLKPLTTGDSAHDRASSPLLLADVVGGLSLYASHSRSSVWRASRSPRSSSARTSPAVPNRSATTSWLWIVSMFSWRECTKSPSARSG